MSTLYLRALAIAPPLVLAPMAGITNLPFRLLCKRQGAGLVCSEMVSATALGYGSRRTLALLAASPEERPLSVQLFGGDPDTMARGAALVCEHGSADLLDINMGCTVPKVVKGGGGAALLADPERAQALVRAVVKASSVPVTVKLRARWRQGFPDAVELGRRCEQAGAAALVLHPRTASGKFTPPLEWELVARLAAAVSVPVIANGGIQDGVAAARVMADTGAQAVMVGRGALGNPWVFARMAAEMAGRCYQPPGRPQRLALAIEHGDMLRELKGERITACEMRKHAGWYVRGFPDAVALREAVTWARTWRELREILAAATAPPPGSGRRQPEMESRPSIPPKAGPRCAR